MSRTATLDADAAAALHEPTDSIGMGLAISQPPAFLHALGPRHQVDTIVTEHGVADLQGKTVHQRGQALAAIAHPDFRDELLEAAARASGGRSPLHG